MKFIGRILFEIIRFPLVKLWHLSGWRMSRDSLEDDKIILTGAPHTSNWDYMLFLLAALYLRRKVYVTAKKELFFPPLGWILRAFGGIPIDRSQSHNLVEQLADRISEADRMLLLFTPEGTRSYRPFWKSGFYWAAVEAGLPIMIGIPNYKEKKIYIDYKLIPSGDIEADFAKIREQQEKYGYGLYPENANPVITRAAYEAQVMDEATDLSRLEQQIEDAEQAELSA